MTDFPHEVSAMGLGELIDRCAAEHPDREALIFPKERLTYRDLASRAVAFAKGLLALGIEAGDRVGYFLPPSADELVILFATAKIGAIAVPINGRFKVRELRQVVAHSGVKAVITASQSTGTDFAALLHSTFPTLNIVDRYHREYSGAPELEVIINLSGNAPECFIDRHAFFEAAETVHRQRLQACQALVRASDAAMIMYTSGTTSMPKGAVLSHESFVRSAEGVVKGRLGVTGQDRVWTPLPLFHIAAVAYAMGVFYMGATLIHTGFFDPDIALAQLRDERCTIALPGFEGLWLPILDHPERKDGDLSALRAVLIVGLEERLRQFQSALPDATLMNTIGMTEACAFVSFTERSDPLSVRVTTGGRPAPGMLCEIHDPETGALLPPGIGELWFRGPAQFNGYFRDVERTANVIDDRGFFKTGDLVRLDADGRVTFINRAKDMLKVGGENVAAAEIEDYLICHPAVRIAQVVAAPDAKYGEVPAAFIELKRDAQASERDIIDFCHGKIATFRIPRYVRFVNEWPMSGTKVQKYVLREAIAKELNI